AAANVEILVDHDHRGAGVARRDRSGQARDAGADDYDVGGVIPARWLHADLACAGASQGCGADAGGRSLGQERSAADIDRRVVGIPRALARDLLAHGQSPPTPGCYKSWMLWHHLDRADGGVQAVVRQVAGGEGWLDGPQDIRRAGLLARRRTVGA